MHNFGLSIIDSGRYRPAIVLSDNFFFFGRFSGAGSIYVRDPPLKLL